MKQKKTPIFIDLDGTLIFTDIFLESLFVLIKKKPLMIFLLPFWFYKGIAFVKKEVAVRVDIDPKSLPYNDKLISRIKKLRLSGEEVILISGSDSIFVDTIAKHLDLFSRTFSSDGEVNLTGEKKVEKIISMYGDIEYEYYGDSLQDIPVWKKSKKAFIISNNKRIKRKLINLKEAEYLHSMCKEKKIRDFFLCIRIHQYLKNLLIFLPVLMAHQFLGRESYLDFLLGFISFCCCTSSTYILNDIFDISSDRIEQIKNKPIANGNVSIKTGLYISITMLLLSFLICLFLPIGFFLTIILYLILTIFYTSVLKKIKWLDVVIISCLLFLRMIAGSFLADIPISPYLMLFSLFLFFNLILSKRVVDLIKLGEINERSRGYSYKDIDLILFLMKIFGFLSICVFSYFTYFQAFNYSYLSPQILSVNIVFIFLWLKRVFVLSKSGCIDREMSFFILKDTYTQIIFLLIIIIFLTATFLQI